jgi:hypothetical protein
MFGREKAEPDCLDQSADVSYRRATLKTTRRGTGRIQASDGCAFSACLEETKLPYAEVHYANLAGSDHHSVFTRTALGIACGFRNHSYTGRSSHWWESWMSASR